MKKEISADYDHLSKYLEQIVFQKEELKELAKNITKLKEEKISLEEYKTKLLRSRVRILTDITEFMNFYIKTHLKSDPYSKSNNDGFNTELENKTILLEEIAKRLQKLDDIFL
jgi:hypothetical protein